MAAWIRLGKKRRSNVSKSLELYIKITCKFKQRNSGKLLAFIALHFIKMVTKTKPLSSTQRL